MPRSPQRHPGPPARMKELGGGGGVQSVSTRGPGPDHHSFPMLVDADAIVTAQRFSAFS